MSAPLAPSVILRRATEADCEQVLAWRNEPATRAMSIDQTIISLAQHQPWFERSLANPRRLLLIGARAELPEVGIGVCRFDIDEDFASAEANINLAAAFHGMRLSVPLLSGGIAAFEAAFPDIRLLHAKIRSENYASRRCFAACGFIEEGKTPIEPVIYLKRRG